MSTILILVYKMHSEGQITDLQRNFLKEMVYDEDPNLLSVYEMID